MTNDLDEFGFEPIEDEADLSEFGFELIEEDLPESVTGVPNVTDIEAELTSGKAKESTIPIDREAALLGFGQGASFGLSPLISGAVGAGTQAIKETGLLDTDQEKEAQAKMEELGIKDTSEAGVLENILKSYYESRDAQKKAESGAFEESPGSFMFGNVAGGVTTMKPTSALAGKLAGNGSTAGKIASKLLPTIDDTSDLKLAAKVGSGIKEGAKAGGLVGLGQGEGRIVGEPGQVLEETLGGAATGAAFGLAASTLANAPGAIASKLPGAKSIKAGYELGKKGIDLEENSVKGEIKTFSEDLYNQIRDTFRKGGLSKADALDFADEVGIKVNAGETIDDAISQVTKQKSLTTDSAREKQKLLDVFNELKGKTIGDKNIESKLTNRIIKDRMEGNLMPKTPELQKGDVAGKSYSQYADSEIEKIYTDISDKLPIDQLDLENASLRDVETLLDEINRYTGDLQQAPKSTQERSARQLAQQLRDLSNNAIEDSSVLGDSNKGVASIFEGLRRGKVKGNVLTNSPNQQIRQVDQLRSLVQGSGDSTEINRERFFEYLQKADPAFKETAKYSEMLNQALNMAKASDLDKSTSVRSLFGTIQGVTGKVGNIAGTGVRSAKGGVDKGVKSLLLGYDKMKSMTPEQAQNLMTKIEQSGKEGYKNFLRPLQKAYTGKDSTKSAILYGLYQQPAFRKMLDDISDTFSDD